MQPVVGAVQRDDVRRAAVVDEDSVHPQTEVCQPADQEVGPSKGVCPGHDEADHPECHVQEVVQDRHREDAEQPRLGVVSRELQLVVVAGHTGQEAQHADDKERAGDDDGRALHRHQLGSLRHCLPPSTSLLTGR